MPICQRRLDAEDITSVKMIDSKQTGKEIDKITKRVARGAGVIFVGVILRNGLSLFLHILLGRFLGTAPYGLYSIGTTIVNLTGRLSSLGMGKALVRFISFYRSRGDDEKVKGTIISALGFPTGFAVIVGGVLFAFSAQISETVFHNPSLLGIIRIFALSLPFCVLMLLTCSAARGFKKMEHHTVIMLSRTVINILIVGCAFLLGFRLYGAIWGFVIATFFSAVLGVYLLVKNFPGLVSTLMPSFENKCLFKFSFPLYLAGFSYLIFSRTDILMIGYFLKPENVGIYRAVIALAGLVNFMLPAFNMSFAPFISELYDKNRLIELGNIYKTVTRWIFLLSLIISLSVILFSKDLLGVFGAEFRIGWSVLVSLAFFQLLSVSAGPVAVMLEMGGKQKWVLLNNVCMVTLNICLNIWLIPRLGILGAGIATGISLVISKVMGLLEVFLFFRFCPWDMKYLKPIIAGSVSLIFFLLVRLLEVPIYWIINLLIVTVVYFSVIYLLGLNKEDILVLSAVKKKIMR